MFSPRPAPILAKNLPASVLHNDYLLAFPQSRLINLAADHLARVKRFLRHLVPQRTTRMTASSSPV